MDQRRHRPHVNEPRHASAVELLGEDDEDNEGQGSSSSSSSVPASVVQDLIGPAGGQPSSNAVAALMSGGDPSRMPVPDQSTREALGTGPTTTGPHPDDEWQFRAKRRRVTSGGRDSDSLLRAAMRRTVLSETGSSTDGSIRVPSSRPMDDYGGEFEDEEDEDGGEGDQDEDEDEPEDYCYLCTIKDDARNMYRKQIVEILSQDMECGLRWVCVRASQHYDTFIRPMQPGRPEWTPQGVLDHITKHNPSQRTTLLENATVLRHLMEGHRRNIRVTDATGKILPANGQTVISVLAIIKAQQSTMTKLAALQNSSSRSSSSTGPGASANH